MHRRQFIKSLAILGSVAAFNPNRMIYGASETEDAKRNILFIFTDDQRYDTIRALGNKHIYTPNLDKLAAKSFVFENGFCFGGNVGAVCIPSRNMTMTGRTFFQFPKNGKDPRADATWPNMPKSMKAAGYETWYQEKSGSANLPHIQKDFEHRKNVHAVKNLRKGRPAKPTVDDAIEFLTEKRDASRPFFMYLGMAGPHDPRWAPKKYRDLYDPSKIPVPPNYLPVHPFDIGDMQIRDECLEAWPRTKEAIQRHLHDYYALISSMDYDIGRLLDTVEKSGLAKNTLIIFSSDQGLALGSHGLMGKQNVYDDTLRVPLMFSGPEVPVGRSEALAYLHDIYPTICDYASASIPKGLDGRSLLPVITDKKKKVRDYLFTAYKDSQRAVRDQQWKLIRFPLINVSRLYNIAEDPRETTDLSSNKKYKDILEKMMGIMRDQQQIYGDKQALTSSAPQKAEFVPPAKKKRTAYPAGGLAPDPWPEDME